MKIKIPFYFILTVFVLMLTACENRYDNDTFYHTDSYSSVFEGKRVPQDVR